MGIETNTYNNKIGQSYAPSYNAVQINLDQPTANIAQQPVIYDYPQADGQIYYPPLPKKPVNFGQNTTVTKTPSGVGDFENYKEIDSNGNVISSVEYFDNGTEITQVINTKSYDGSTIEKVTTNGNGVNKMTLAIKDENGNILLNKEKSHARYGNDMALTVVNGEEYKTTGLSGDIITIEHNGQVTTIDLNKLVSSDTKVLPEDKVADWTTKKDGLTPEDKEKLLKQIKDMPADDLLKVNKIINSIHRLEERSGYESFYSNNDEGQLLLFGRKIGNSTALHELGHAVNNADGKTNRSDLQHYIDIRKIEEENFLKRCNTKDEADEWCKDKFTDVDNLIKFGMTKEDAISVLRDETFAEAYSILNNPTITPSDDQFQTMRALGHMKAFPKTMVEVEKHSEV
ncbi:MAG: hypothetical protein K6E29_01680 [Cyanobacteria bacterium RUI128]|nr:hypothetical protein [Cyanobacteria bacterium RUI128]